MCVYRETWIFIRHYVEKSKNVYSMISFNLFMLFYFSFSSKLPIWFFFISSIALLRVYFFIVLSGLITACSKRFYDECFSFSLRSFWFLVWRVIFDWNLDVFSIMLWDCGSYLNFMFWLTSEMEHVLPLYCHMGVDVQVPRLVSMDTQGGDPRNCWVRVRVLAPQ